jgi:hypothetical protein
MHSFTAMHKGKKAIGSGDLSMISLVYVYT